MGAAADGDPSHGTECKFLKPRLTEDRGSVGTVEGPCGGGIWTPGPPRSPRGGRGEEGCGAGGLGLTPTSPASAQPVFSLTRKPCDAGDVRSPGSRPRAGRQGGRRLAPRPSTNAPPRTRTDVCRDPHASLRLACCGGSTRGKDPAVSGCRSLGSSLPKVTASEGSRTCAGPRHTSRPGRSRPAGCDAISSFNTLPCLGPASPRREHILSRRRRKASYPRRVSSGVTCKPQRLDGISDAAQKR